MGWWWEFPTDPCPVDLGEHEVDGAMTDLSVEHGVASRTDGTYYALVRKKVGETEEVVAQTSFQASGDKGLTLISAFQWLEAELMTRFGLGVDLKKLG